MSEDYKVEVNRLVNAATGYSDSDVALLQEATRLADAHHDLPLGITTRIKLISAANFSGQYELVLVEFAWCLAQIDKNPQLRDLHEYEILWYYKWGTVSLSEYAQVSRAQIEKSFADMAQRFERNGQGIGPILKCRTSASIRLGDVEAFRQYRDLWLQSPRSTRSDCAACDADAEVRHNLELYNVAAALKAAAPLINGALTCATVPCATFGRLLLPLLSIGEFELAANLNRRTLRKALSNRDFIEALSAHAAYLALIGNEAKAISTVETAISYAATIRRAWELLNFYPNTILVFDILAKRQADQHEADKPIKLRIPPTLSYYNEDGAYLAKDVAEAMKKIHDQTLKAMNDRNGNTTLSIRYEKFLQLVASIPEAPPLP